MIYLLVELLDHHITSFYIKYRFFGVICTFGNFIIINIEIWDQNYVKWLNSDFLSKFFLERHCFHSLVAKTVRKGPSPRLEIS